MEKLIKKVQEQLDNNLAVDASDIQILVNSYVMQNDLLIEKSKRIQDLKDKLNYKIEKEYLIKIISGCIKSVEKDHGEILIPSLAKRIAGNINGKVKEELKNDL